MAEGSTGYNEQEPKPKEIRPTLDDICNALGA